MPSETASTNALLGPLVSDCTNVVQPQLDQLLTGVVVLDAALCIHYMNSAAETILDGSRKRLFGQPLFSLFSYSSLNSEVLQSAIAEQQSVSDSDVSLVFADGQRITIEFIAQPLLQPDGSMQVLVELRQVDQIRRINQENSQQQQLSAAHAMIRGLAHEIKNPLGGLRGAAQLLASELPDPTLREYTDLIINQADRLRNLVDRMLGSHQLPQRRSENIHALIERVCQLVSLSVSPTIDWQRDYDPSLPELSLAADALEQALLNMVLNACEAMGENGVLTMRTRIIHQQTIYGSRYRHCALIVVQDNGPGIAAAVRETLFYPMVSGRAGGTGLGLSIAQNVVHQHGGKIEVMSEPGHTEFLIYLPYLESRVEKSTEVSKDPEHDH
jgi:two-component system nitrogen regulation sensor histidine kinase GlnL